MPSCAAEPPSASRLLMYVAWAGVMFVNVCAGKPGASGGNVTEPVKPCATLLVKKPDSLRRRCSKAKKKKVRSRSKGPPIVNPYCERVNGGSSIGAKALRA